MSDPIAYILCGFLLFGGHSCRATASASDCLINEKTPRRCNVRGVTQNPIRRFQVEVIVGQEFGRWKVIEFLGRDAQSKQHFLCRCECGTERSVARTNLLRGVSRSCGCLKLELSKVRFVTHGATVHGVKAKGYDTWVSMLKRCRNTNCVDYPQYGGRGISVCDRWHSFANFRSDMGEPPTGCSIDRIDVNGNYEPGNCRWASALQQSQNRTNVYRLTYEGETKCLAEWARCLAVSRNTIEKWLKRGESFPSIASRYGRREGQAV